MNSLQITAEFRTSRNDEGWYAYAFNMPPLTPVGVGRILTEGHETRDACEEAVRSMYGPSVRPAVRGV